MKSIRDPTKQTIFSIVEWHTTLPTEANRKCRHLAISLRKELLVRKLVIIITSFNGTPHTQGTRTHPYSISTTVSFHEISYTPLQSHPKLSPVVSELKLSGEGQQNQCLMNNTTKHGGISSVILKKQLCHYHHRLTAHPTQVT